jgi:cell division protein ZipA
VAAELRWILLALSLPLLAGIWWWTARRTRQAAGNAELRESTAAKAAGGLPPLDPRYLDSDDDDMEPEPKAADWGVPPFEPLNIRSAHYDGVPVLDGPMMVNVESVSAARAAPPMMAMPAPRPAPAPPIQAPPVSAQSIPAQPILAQPITAQRVPTAAADVENSDRFASGTAPAPNVSETQKIVAIRVCAPGEARWSGIQLTAALELHGLAFGRYQVFHRKHVDGRSLFCVASLVEPGTFDLAGMADQQFRGVTMFAVLPGPLDALETMDELFGTARGLAQELSGMVQDAQGMPLSPQRAAVLREEVARFQAMVPRQAPGN